MNGPERYRIYYNTCEAKNEIGVKRKYYRIREPITNSGVRMNIVNLLLYLPIFAMFPYSSKYMKVVGTLLVALQFAPRLDDFMENRDCQPIKKKNVTNFAKMN